MRRLVCAVAVVRTYAADIQQGEEAVIAMVESLCDAIVLLEARIAVLEGHKKKNSKNFFSCR
jgi:hypothetical protein